jgi:hypothetical protein
MCAVYCFCVFIARLANTTPSCSNHLKANGVADKSSDASPPNPSMDLYEMIIESLLPHVGQHKPEVLYPIN